MKSDQLDAQISRLRQQAEDLETIKKMLERDPTLEDQLRKILDERGSAVPKSFQRGSLSDLVIQALGEAKSPLTIAQIVSKTGRDKASIRQVLYRLQKARFQQHKRFKGLETGFSLRES